MKIESPRFGSITVEPDKIIEFPAGLPGFEDCKRFTLLHAVDAQIPQYFILQSLDDGAVAFHITDPTHLGFNYEIALTDEQTALLGVTNPADCAVSVILSKESEAHPLRANLNAPLVINLATRRGLQHGFAQLSYEITLKG